MKVTIKDSKLNISIPIEHLKHGIEHHPFDPKKITDIDAMACFYKKAMTNETLGDGENTLFEQLLDKISVLAIEGGEDWIEWDEDYK